MCIVEMLKNEDGNLLLGQCIETTGNRIHLPQGKFDRADGPWKCTPSILSDFDLHAKWVFNTSKLLLLAAFKGDVKQIGVVLYKEQKVMEDPETEPDDDEEQLRDRSPTPTIRESHRGLTSPAKVGECQQKKNAAARVKKENKRIYGIYKRWVDEVTKFNKDVQVATGGDDKSESSEGKRKRGSPWAPLQAEVFELRKKLNVALKKALECKPDMDSRSHSTCDDSVSQAEYEKEVAHWKGEFQKSVNKQLKVQSDFDKSIVSHTALLQSVQTDLKDSQKTILHNLELHKAALTAADLTGYVRGMENASQSRGSSQIRPGNSQSPMTLSCRELIGATTIPPY